MKLKRLKITKSKLSNIPEAERIFLLMAGHMQNEIVSLNKMLMWCLSSDGPTSKTESLVDGMQGFMIARILAGKLNEGWQFITRAYFNTKISKDLNDQFHESTLKALEELKKYFSRKNLISLVRNSFSFHYSQNEIAKYWEEAACEPDFDFLIGDNSGNTFLQASEIAVAFSLLKSIDPNIETALKKFLNDVQKVVGLFIDFLDGVIFVLLTQCFEGEFSHLGVEEEITPNRNIDEISIPFFYAPPTK